MSDNLMSNFSAEELEQLKSDPELKTLFSSVGGFDDSPSASSKDSLLRFFRDILALKDEDFDKISRVGNLKEYEVGNLALSTRGYLSLAKYSDSENLEEVSSYLRGQSNIVLNTSLSRAAKLLNLVISQKKFSGIIEPKRTEVKKTMFGEKRVEVGGEE